MNPVCPGDTSGYLCDDSNKWQYFECNDPWYVGWRDCPSGTFCTDSSKLHSEIPCTVSAHHNDDASDSYIVDDNDDPDVPDNHVFSELNWEAQYGVVKSWNTWWLWVSLAGYCVIVAIVGWIGCVTWPNTHSRLASATHRCIC